MNRLISVVFLFLLVNSAAQQLPDSVIKRLSLADEKQHDKIFLELSVAATETNPAMGIVYAQKGIELAEKRNEKQTQASLLTALGHNYALLAKYPEAMNAFKHALKIVEVGNNKKAITYILNNLANIYSDLSANDRALEYYLKSLGIAKEIKDSAAISMLYSNIGGVYGNLNNYDKEIEFYKKALDLNKAVNDSLASGLIYGNLGLAYIHQGNSQQALICLDSALFFCKAVNDLVGIAEVYGSYGEYYYMMKDFSKALTNYQKSLSAADEVGDIKTAGENYYRIASVYFELNQIAKAKTYGKLSLIKANQTGLLTLQKNSLSLLLKVYDSAGNRDSAFLISKRLLTVTDSLHKIESSKQVNSLLVVYENEQKESEIFRLSSEKEVLSLKASQNKQTIIFLSVLAIVILGALIGTLFLYKEKTRLTRKLEENNRELTDSQSKLKEALTDKDKFISILAHDLRNPFNAMLPFADELRGEEITPEDRIILAEELYKVISSTYQLLHNLLLWAGTQSGKMELSPEEFNLKIIADATRDSFSAQAKAKEVDFSMEFTGDATVTADIETVHIILRNLVGNAIKFTGPNGKVTVTGNEGNEYYTVTVKDTGIGMNPALVERILGNESIRSSSGTGGEKGTGIGLTLCKEFILRNKGSLSISSEPDSGSVFSFTLPKK